MTDYTPDQLRIRAAEARQVLDSPHFKEAFQRVADYLEAKALAWKPDSADAPEMAARIVMAKQLLQSVRREMERKLDDGYMAEVQIAELEQQRKRGLFQFRR